MRRPLLHSMSFHVFAATVVLLYAAPTFAQVEYTTATGVEVAWTLDPRAFPDLFPRGPAFGASRVLAGMDFDGDGNKEILFTADETIAPQGGGTGHLDVYLYENTGDDAYEYVWHYSHPDTSNSNPPVEWGDLDGDGLYEIYMGIPTIDDAADLFIFEQNEDKTFPAEPTIEYDYGREAELDFRPAAFAVGDVDGDGQVELVTTSRTSGLRETVVISPVAGIDPFTVFNIELEVGNDLLAGGAIYDVEIVDFDNDGMSEIWINTWNFLSMTIFEATGADTYELQVDINEVDPEVDHGSIDAMRFYDVDGDGRLELVFPSSEGEFIILDDTDDVSTLTGAEFAIVGSFTPGTSRGGDVGDLDHDGAADIIVNTSEDEELIWIEYSGTGDVADSTSYTWTTILSAPDTSGGRFYPLRIADDLDGDGFNEIVMANLYATDEEQPLILVVEVMSAITSREEEGIPGRYILEQNYPNPFNPATQIVFETPVAGPVRLTVYDVMGREVEVLMDGTVAAGRHEVSFEAHGLPSGIYLIRMVAPNQVLTRKATLIR